MVATVTLNTSRSELFKEQIASQSVIPYWLVLGAHREVDAETTIIEAI